MATTTVYAEYYQNSQTENARMDIYAYNAPSDGTFTLEGQKYLGVRDYRTAQHYAVYKNCGFNTLLAGASGYFNDEQFADSSAKKVLDTAYAAALSQVIVLDQKLYALSQVEGGIIGENKQFATEAELDAWVEERTSFYRDHPAFFGVQLADMPKHTQLEAVGAVYRSIKRVCPKAFIHINLAHMVFRYEEVYEPAYEEGWDFYDRYEAYVKMYFEQTGADHVSVDAYPFEEGWSEGFQPYYFRNIQILEKVAKTYGAQLHFTLQAWGQYVNGKLAHRIPSAQEMNLQLHALLGFGAKKLSYHQYWSSTDNRFFGAYSPDGWAIVHGDGQPTPLYAEVQRLNATAQKLMPVLNEFTHVSETYAAVSPFVSKPMHIKFTLRNQMKNAELSTSQEMAMAHELYDEKRGQYLYVVQNITCPLFGKDLPKQTSKITFSKNWTKVDVFDGNEWRTENLVDGTFTAELENGDAVYLLPY